MNFKVVSHNRYINKGLRDHAWLITDNWDDWFKYKVQYYLVYIDSELQYKPIGEVKIGQLRQNEEKPAIGTTFDKLDERFFSLGQDDSYYENLNLLGEDIRDIILLALRDVAKDQELFENVLNENVTQVGLLRSINPKTVRGQFNRLTEGGVRLSEYDFTYITPKIKGKESTSIELNFHVEPESNPPTNIHVLVGRNGVGKTHIINSMANAIINPNYTKYGTFSSTQYLRRKTDLFLNLVSVTFSAFDESEPLPEIKDKNEPIQCSYVGLKRPMVDGKINFTPKSPAMLKTEFVKSVRTFNTRAKLTRWQQSLQILESDPIFKEADVSDVIEDTQNEERLSILFNKLSSGHKIVLLTITKLVETVEEKSLVLIDEPEAHLHPPLLSAFIRALSNLLIQRNGVAIIATHSPVVLQEVPRSCVWKLRRTGAEARAERLEVESFGENVGVLTREVFGLEVTHSGFHKLLSDSIEREDGDYDDLLNFFNDQLGMEARAILRGLINQR